jgi:hypothetical protein
MAVPTLDAPLAAWSRQFLAVAGSATDEFAVSPAQIAQYALLHDAYIASYNAAAAPGARSKALVMDRKSAKAPLLRMARSLYGQIRAAPVVSNENKTRIGITLRRKPAGAVPPPQLPPMLAILSVAGRMVQCKLTDRATPGVRRKPRNAQGAMILSYVGDQPPPTTSVNWKIEKQTGRPKFTITFGAGVQPAVRCWLSARWYNRRGQYSPACEPVFTYLQVGPAPATNAQRSAPILESPALLAA